MNNNNIKWENLPIPTLFNKFEPQIAPFISDYLVVMLGHRENDAPIHNCYGTGVLCRINSVYGILTARHVWVMFKKEMGAGLKKISLPLPKYPTKFIFDVQYLRPYLPNDANADICFLKIPENLVANVKAQRTFIEIAPDKMPDFSIFENCMMVSAGFPYLIQDQENGKLRPLRYYTDFKNLSYNKWPTGYDDFELNVCYLDPSAIPPETLEGMSGGGTWSFLVLVKAGNDSQDNYEVRLISKHSPLVGINYYQSPLVNKCRTIKAMGIHSIYEMMPQVVI
jgi:hypothetical protein